jgi:hypothetical protein
MAKYTSKIMEVEAITFDELIAYGKENCGPHIVGGMPSSFDYKGYPVSHENDKRYLITFPVGGYHDMTPDKMLVSGIDLRAEPYLIIYTKQDFALIFSQKPTYVNLDKDIIEPMRKTAIDFLEAFNKMSPRDKCTVHPPAGSGAGPGIYNRSMEDIFNDWFNSRITAV